MKNKMVIEFPEWQGDLTDNCWCRFEDLVAHAECLDEIQWRGSGERKLNKAQLWYCSIYRVDERGHMLGNEIFHSGEYGGFIVNGDMARGICEAIMIDNAKAKNRPYAY